MLTLSALIVRGNDGISGSYCHQIPRAISNYNQTAAVAELDAPSSPHAVLLSRN